MLEIWAWTLHLTKLCKQTNKQTPFMESLLCASHHAKFWGIKEKKCRNKDEQDLVFAHEELITWYKSATLEHSRKNILLVYLWSLVYSTYPCIG